MTISTHIEALGRLVSNGVRIGFELWDVLVATLWGALRGKRPKGEVLQQAYHIGNRSLLFIGVTLGFIGMVMIYQTGSQVNRITGDVSPVGREFAKLLIQDFAPTLTAMMLATRVGAGIAAEIGSMKVTEQIDALRMSGVAPIDYLIVPRFIATLIMSVVLSIFGAVVAFAAAGLTAHLSFGVNPRVFFDASRVEFLDLGLGLSKCVAYGIAIPVVSGFCGLRATGSSEGVGWATTSAVIGSSFAVINIDLVISAIGFVLQVGG
jgi:phospholipid/cholesterol/gamma-HCH transport system permease protein